MSFVPIPDLGAERFRAADRAMSQSAVLGILLGVTFALAGVLAVLMLFGG